MNGIDLRYGETSLRINLPDDATVDEYAPHRVATACSFEQFLAAFQSGGGEAFIQIEHPLIVVNDAHRSTPTEQLLGWLDTIDNTILDRSTFLVACGTHASPDELELQKIFGEHLPRVMDRVNWHDARDASLLAEIGKDRNGEPVMVNRLFVEASGVLLISSVEPHYFAGFTGGRKSIFPGLTDFETVERNHNLANSLDCAPMRLDGNPMAEHLDYLLSLIATERLFSIQSVYDADGTIAVVRCGDVRSSFREATQIARQLYGNQSDRQYDLVFCEMESPLDRNLYQLQKGVENTQAAVADGGSMIVLSPCSDGIGSRAFYDLAGEWDQTANAAKDGLLKFGSHKLSRVVAMQRRIRVLVASELDDADVQQVFYRPVHAVQSTVDEIVNRSDERRVALVKDAGNTVVTFG
jgi:nickel-dependent lactate racemase